MKKAKKNNTSFIIFSLLLIYILAFITIVALNNHIHFNVIFILISVFLSYFISILFFDIAYVVRGFFKKEQRPLVFIVNPFVFRRINSKIIFNIVGFNEFNGALTVPKINLPETKEEFQDIRNNILKDKFIGNIGSIILLLIDFLLMYMSYIYIKNESLLLYFDFFIMTNVLFNLFNIFYSTLKNSNSIMGFNEKVKIKQDSFYAAKKVLILSSYNQNFKYKKQNFILRIISDSFTRIINEKQVDFDDIMVLDFVMYEFITKHITRLNVGYERMIQFLFDNKDEVLSSFKGNDKKKVYMVYEHMVLYYYTKNETEKARELFLSLPDFSIENEDNNSKKHKKKIPQIDLSLTYLYKENEHFLRINDNIQFLENAKNRQYCYPDSVGRLFYNYKKLDKELMDRLTKVSETKEKRKKNKNNKKGKKKKKKKKKK